MAFGPLVGAIDEGTTSARFIIFKAASDEIICSHQISVPSIFPHEGWCEQDPMLIISTVIKCIEEALKELKRLGGDPKDIVAVGITNQRESTIVWDKNTGKPFANAIIWLDGRTTTTIDNLLAKVPEDQRNINYLKRKCGLPLSTYFSAVKLRWLKDNIKSVKDAMETGDCYFGTIDTWLVWNLTGGANHGLHITDCTNASRTMLMNLETLNWDSELLEFFGIPKNVLPEIRSSSENYGSMTSTSLKGTPICSILGDQHAALCGQQCFSIGEAKTTYGTGAFLLYNTGTSIIESNSGLLTTMAFKLGKDAKPMYALEGSVAIAGAAISWLKDNINLIDSVSKVEEYSKKVDCGDVYFVPAFNGLFAPYWNTEARGVIVGMNENTKKEHIVRATLESICFRVADILTAMKNDCGTALKKLKVDGGVTSSHVMLQIQADLIGIDVALPKINETTCLGSALAAYRGFTGSKNIEFQSVDSSEKLFKPQISKEEREDRYARWKMAVERCFGWATKDENEENQKRNSMISAK